MRRNSVCRGWDLNWHPCGSEALSSLGWCLQCLGPSEVCPHGWCGAFVVHVDECLALHFPKTRGALAVNRPAAGAREVHTGCEVDSAYGGLIGNGRWSHVGRARTPFVVGWPSGPRGERSSFPVESGTEGKGLSSSCHSPSSPLVGQV